MTTTTIRLDEDLKARVAAAAAREGKSTHAFIVDAVARTVERIEHDAAFHAVADKRWARLLKTGETLSLEQTRTWIEGRLRGERPGKPAPRKR